MTKRMRRDNTTAEHIAVGDIIEPHNNGYRAKVHSIGTLDRITTPHVVIDWAYPDDFSVNANLRGQSGSRIYRPSNPVTRWVQPKGTIKP